MYEMYSNISLPAALRAAQTRRVTEVCVHGDVLCQRVRKSNVREMSTLTIMPTRTIVRPLNAVNVRTCSAFNVHVRFAKSID